MPMTYGLPEPEPTRTEQVQSAVNAVVASNSVVRTTVLYVLTALLLITNLAPLAIVPLVLLLATDTRLS